MAERFEMLEEFYVIRSLILYYDETCGCKYILLTILVFGIQGLYLLSDREWFASNPHKSLSKRFSSIEPIKSVTATFESFQNHEKKILVSVKL
jgi:hypothetical protein